MSDAVAWARSTALTGSVLALAERVADADGVAAISGHVLAAVRAGSADVLPAARAEVPPGAARAEVPPGNAQTLLGGAHTQIGGAHTQIDSAHTQIDSAHTQIGLAHTQIGGAAGYAVAIDGDPAEVAVDPAARGRGIGTVLVRAAVARQGAVWAYGDLPAARTVAARLGLDRTRMLLQMRRPLPVEPVGTGLPGGVRIRTFEPGKDDEAFLAVNARAFANHPEQGRLDLAGLRDEMSQDWFDPAGFFLAVTDPGDELLGFHWTKVHEHDRSAGRTGESGPIGEIYVLGVDPDAGVRGLGTVLAQVGLRHLADRGLRTVMLYVEADNDRALRLYERAGFVVHLTNVVYRPPATL